MFIFCCKTFWYIFFLSFLGLHTFFGPYNIYIFYNQYSSGSFRIPYIFHIVVFSECAYVWVSLLLFLFCRHVASSLGSWGFISSSSAFNISFADSYSATIENFAPDHPTFLNSFMLGVIKFFLHSPVLVNAFHFGHSQYIFFCFPRILTIFW